MDTIGLSIGHVHWIQWCPLDPFRWIQWTTSPNEIGGLASFWYCCPLDPMDIMSNEHHVQWTSCPMDIMSNGHHVQWTPLNTIIRNVQWTLRPMDITMSIGVQWCPLDPMDIMSNEHDVLWTPLNTNGHNIH